jgi:hypothetical protein
MYKMLPSETFANDLDHAIAKVLVEGRSLLRCLEEVASMQDVDNRKLESEIRR